MRSLSRFNLIATATGDLARGGR